MMQDRAGARTTGAAVMLPLVQSLTRLGHFEASGMYMYRVHDNTTVVVHICNVNNVNK